MKLTALNGDHYKIGLQIGKQMAAAIHESFDEWVYYQETLLPFFKSTEGQDLYKSLVRIQEKEVPEYVLELQGMADGAERPLKDLIYLNMLAEFKYFSDHERSLGCSNCSLCSSDQIYIGHNEDGNAFYKGKPQLFEINLEKNSRQTVKFTSLIYPGMLAGYAFGFNEFGICETGYTATPNDIRLGIGRNFISRSLCEATSVDDAIKRVTPSGRACGFSYTIASIHEQRLVHVEVSAQQQHVKEIDGAFAHTNHYVELKDVQAFSSLTEHSQIRYRRACQIINEHQVSSRGDVERVLFDRHSKDQFVFASDPDLMTLLSVIFDITQKKMLVYEFGDGAEKQVSEYTIAS